MRIDLVRRRLVHIPDAEEPCLDAFQFNQFANSQIAVQKPDSPARTCTLQHTPHRKFATNTPALVGPNRFFSAFSVEVY